MICAWNDFLSVLPLRIRNDVDYLGREELEELRLRCNAPPELVFARRSIVLSIDCTREDLQFVINAASRYSPWAAVTSAQGYITIRGGHRIGICGTVIRKDGIISGVGEVTSLCIRIARDYVDIAPEPDQIFGSVLILGAPGWGKTTLLRDLVRKISKQACVCVADERGEIFPAGFDRGQKTDVLTGCGKGEGIEMLLRTMGPSYIAVDEITAQTDCEAILQATNCGVHFLATAHAASLQEFQQRKVYHSLIYNNVFDTFLLLHRDKTITKERAVV